jgi:hypothetical protein
MRTSALIAALFWSPVFLFAQQASAPLEPEYSDQLTVFTQGKLVPLERETAVTDTQSRRNFVITPNTKVFESIPNPASPVRTSSKPHFIVKLNIGDRDPATFIHLRPLVAGKKDRRIPITTISRSLIPFAGPKHDTPTDNSLPIVVRKYGAHSLEIVPQQPLQAGEYAFVNGHEAQCFGVDANQPEESPIEPVGSASAPRVPITPRPPSHPTNTVRDVPPAAPGYPAIHASHDAQEGCWWIPFFSEKFQLEAAVQTCADRKMTTLVLQMEDGLGLQYQGDAPVKPPERFVQIVSKNGDQSIEIAIKQQFISRLKVAAARTACKAIRGYGSHDPADTGISKTNPELKFYAVEASGPYAKLKKFQGEEAESPCEDLQMNDVMSSFFAYNPTESKTKYLFFQEDDNGNVFDQDSVHFMPQQ